MTNNMRAFLSMIAAAEGTLGIGQDGYNVLVGSRKTQALLFTSYTNHPRVEIRLRRDDPATPADEELISSAAGRYQILWKFWEPYVVKWGLTDFSPPMQDKWATNIITIERKAAGDIEAGLITMAIGKCKNQWASLPGAGYKQAERSFDFLLSAYTMAGGVLTK
jgi:muramidase (phage lysozyme)